MKKSMLFAAAAVVAMASCTNEDFTGFQQAKNGESAINFGSGTKKLTRAENDIKGAEAAGLLDNNFVVKGFKGDGTFSTLPQSVFDFYNVNYVSGTAGSTESNSSNWEYVGQDVNKLAIVSTQTIKYWDFAEDQYDFVAFSAGKNTSATPKTTADVLFKNFNFTKIGSTTATDYVYEVTGTLEQLKECYIADLVTVYNPALFGTGEALDGKTGLPQYASGAVTPVFRRMQSKIRMGIYETVPGYSVKDVKFYNETGGATSTSGPILPNLYMTGTAALAIGGDATGTMEVSFPTVGKDNVDEEDYNKARITFKAATSGSTGLVSNVAFGDGILAPYGGVEYKEATGDYLGRTSATATYAGDVTKNYYVPVLPTSKGQVLNLKVDYTLVSIDGSGEEINVVGASAQVPAVYTEWQPNYAYTYLFKISDQTNGLTDPGQPGYVGLYPITFDAVVMGDIDGIQETITEIGVPSITTYQKGKVVTENDEYVGQDTIFTVVKKDGDVQTLYTAADKGNIVGFTQVFTATVADGALQTITEKSADNCFFNGVVSGNTITVTDAAEKTLVLTHATQGEKSASGQYCDDKYIYAPSAPSGVQLAVSNVWLKPTAGNVYVLQTLTEAGVYDAATGNYHEGVTYYDENFVRLATPTNVSTDLSKYYKIDPAHSGTDDVYTKVTTGKFSAASKIHYYKFDGTEYVDVTANLKDGDDLTKYSEDSATIDLYTKTDGEPAQYIAATGFYEGANILASDETAYSGDPTKQYYTKSGNEYTSVAYADLKTGDSVASGTKTCTTPAKYAYKVIIVK